MESNNTDSVEKTTTEAQNKPPLPFMEEKKSEFHPTYEPNQTSSTTKRKKTSNKKKRKLSRKKKHPKPQEQEIQQPEVQQPPPQQEPQQEHIRQQVEQQQRQNCLYINFENLMQTMSGVGINFMYTNAILFNVDLATTICSTTSIIILCLKKLLKNNEYIKYQMTLSSIKSSFDWFSIFCIEKYDEFVGQMSKLLMNAPLLFDSKVDQYFNGSLQSVRNFLDIIEWRAAYNKWLKNGVKFDFEQLPPSDLSTFDEEILSCFENFKPFPSFLEKRISEFYDCFFSICLIDREYDPINVNHWTDFEIEKLTNSLVSFGFSNVSKIFFYAKTGILTKSIVQVKEKALEMLSSDIISNDTIEEIKKNTELYELIDECFLIVGKNLDVLLPNNEHLDFLKILMLIKKFGILYFPNIMMDKKYDIKPNESFSDLGKFKILITEIMNSKNIPTIE